MKRNKQYILWRETVLNRDDNKCIICGNGPKYLNCHHLIPKNFEQFALDVDNGLTLCPSCHTLGKWSAHKNPIWFTKWLQTNMWDTYRQVLDRLESL